MITWLLTTAWAAPARDAVLGDPTAPIVEQPWMGPAAFAVVGVLVIGVIFVATRKR